MDGIKEHVDLCPYTYFKIGGEARYFTEVHTEEELKNRVRFAKARSIPIAVIGAASNILVSDAGYPGLVIRMMLRDISRDGNVLRAGAGVPNALVVSRALAEGLSGFEWAIGIPGTLGGSIRGNAGCFSGEMKDIMQQVRFFDTETGEFDEGDNDFCKFGYRDSIFKKKPNLIITSADLLLRETQGALGQKLVRYYTWLRSGSQDIGTASAGCIFKNVAWPREKEARERLLEAIPQLADFASRPAIPAAFLIDQGLGLKGRSLGKVFISPKHANYLINKGGARAEEVVMLVGLIKEYVHRKYNLFLEEEVEYVGFL